MGEAALSRAEPSRSAAQCHYQSLADGTIGARGFCAPLVSALGVCGVFNHGISAGTGAFIPVLCEISKKHPPECRPSAS